MRRRPYWRALVLLLAVGVLAGAVSSSALAKRSAWYWTNGQASAGLEKLYDEPGNPSPYYPQVTCLGYGESIGRRAHYFRRFRCVVVVSLYDSINVKARVVGKWRIKVVG